MAARARELTERLLRAALFCAAACAALGVAACRWGPWPWDRGVQTAQAWLAFWLAVSALGHFGAYAVLATAVLLLGLAVRRMRGTALATVAGLATLWWLGDGAKRLFHRPRPAGWHGALETSFSYPSGHAELSLFFYGAVALWLLWPYTRGTVRVATVAACALVALAIAASRIALGVHYLTDVLGGWLLGAAWLLAATAVLDLAPRARRGDSRP